MLYFRIVIYVNYLQPCQTTEKLQIAKSFYNQLATKTNEYKRKTSQIYVIGDFNTRSSALTNDHGSNSCAPYLFNYLHDTKLKIANTKWANGVLTKVLSGAQQTGGSIVDYLMTDDINNIQHLNIDTHPIFTDHRPIIFSTTNSKTHVTSDDKHYVFRNVDPTDEQILEHGTTIKHANYHMNKFLKTHINKNKNISKYPINNICPK